MKMETRYSGITIENSKNIDADSKYDNYDLGTLNALIMNSQYTGTKIDKLSTKLKLVNGYGGFSVGQIPAGFESITIDNRYAGIKLGIESGASYKLNGKVRYSNIQHPDGKLNRLRADTSYEVDGTVGNGENPKSTVRIESSYGNVNLMP